MNYDKAIAKNLPVYCNRAIDGIVSRLWGCTRKAADE